MMGRTHSPTGAVIWLGVAPWVTFNPVVMFAGLCVAWVLAKAPDLDHPNSTASRALWGPFHRRIGEPFSALVGGHRGFLHTIWAVLLVSALSVALTALVEPVHALAMGAAAGSGWLGGVLPDMLTKDRVRIAWPLLDDKVGLPIFKTNGIGETVFRWTMYAAMLYLAYATHTHYHA